MRKGTGFRVRGSRAGLRLLGAGLMVCGLGQGASGADSRETVYQLKEVSAFGHPGSSFATGQRGTCQNQPLKEIKAYPNFVSSKPIYGSVCFEVVPGLGRPGVWFYFAADESRGTGKGYDRLYLDLNRNLELWDDAPLKPWAKAPEGAKLTWSDTKQQVCFEPCSVLFDGRDAGKIPVELMPRLVCVHYPTGDSSQMFFVRTRIRTGTIKLGHQELEARLGNAYLISSRLDGPATVLELTPVGGGSQFRWWGGDSLLAAHRVDRQSFTFSASPTGDRLTVHPYRGELGTFKMGLGGRKLDKTTVRGSLRSTNLSVAVGGEIEDGWPKAARSCEVPAGDYLPAYLTIEFGRLRLTVSENYHSEGKALDRGGRAPVYGMAVRKGKPFVLDFSNVPEVMFTSPKRAQRVRRGDELQVKAVLTDPKLDIMIRGLEDTTRKQTKTAEGQPVTHPRNLSLDPRVLITRASNGEKVAEGVMPFG